MSGSPARTILTIVMDVLIACAVAVTLRLGVEFFGQLAAQSWGKAVVAFTNPLVIPFGVHAIKTPYGGVFDVNAAAHDRRASCSSNGFFPAFVSRA